MAGLNVPAFWISMWFWICQVFEYARVTQGSKHAWIYLNNSRISLIMPEYAWMCEYTCICRNMRKYAQIRLNVFCFRFSNCNRLSTCMLDYLFQHVHESRSYGLFSRRSKKKILPIAAGIWFIFRFRRNIFTSKISNLLLSLGPVRIFIKRMQKITRL